MRIQSHFNSIEGRVSQSLGVSYGKLVAVAFKAIQELEARVKELENK